jgi:predicted outer membrane protein
MSASLKLKGGVLAGALSCLVAGLAVAQQLQQPPGTQPRPGQPGQPGQRDRATTQPAQQGQQYTAEFRGTQTTGAPASQEIENYLANCLLIKNKAEVELSQFAQQQAQNPEVKEFAQMLIKDHQQAIQKLQALAGAQGAGTTSQRPNARQYDTQTTPPANERPGQALNRNADQSLTTTRPGVQNDALNQLLELDRQITERSQEMVREELQAKSGPEFDYCFVGAQIGSHTHMLAALDVIGQRSQGELRQFVQEAKPVVQRHLDHAKQLAKTQMQAQLGGRAGAQAERQPGQTQQR